MVCKQTLCYSAVNPQASPLLGVLQSPLLTKNISQSLSAWTALLTQSTSCPTCLEIFTVSMFRGWFLSPGASVLQRAPLGVASCPAVLQAYSLGCGAPA